MNQGRLHRRSTHLRRRGGGLVLGEPVANCQGEVEERSQRVFTVRRFNRSGNSFRTVTKSSSLAELGIHNPQNILAGTPQLEEHRVLASSARWTKKSYFCVSRISPEKGWILDAALNLVKRGSPLLLNRAGRTNRNRHPRVQHHKWFFLPAKDEEDS